MQEPKWGDPGYSAPVPPRPKAGGVQKWVLWGVLALGVVGQVLYWWAVGGNTDTNNDGCIDGSESPYAHGWWALPCFLVAVIAAVLAFMVYRRNRPRPPKMATVILALTIGNVAWLALLPLGAACW